MAKDDGRGGAIFVVKSTDQNTTQPGKYLVVATEQ